MSYSRPIGMLYVSLALLATSACACRNMHANGGPGNGGSVRGANLPGVDASNLTPRERRLWYGFTQELLAPCPEVAVSLAQCIKEQRPCDFCLPAAEFLVRQVRAGLPPTEVFQLYEARFDPGKVRTVVVAGSEPLGPASAAVTVVEWADFQCPACGAFSEALYDLREQHADDVRLVFKHFRVRFHPQGKLSCRAAFAALQLGKFWPMHRLLYAYPDRLAETDLISYAGQLELDIDRFTKDLHSEQSRLQVEKEKRQGSGLGVDRTPTIFVNGRRVPLEHFADPLDELEAWIKLEIDLAKAKDR